MSSGELEDIGAFLLRAARDAGATAADVLVAAGDSLSVEVRLAEVDKVKRARSRHLGLRVFVGDRSAVTSSADFSRTALAELATESVALARVTASDPYSGLPVSDELARSVPDLDLYDPAITKVTADRALEWCRAGEAAALESDERLTNSDGADFSTTTAIVAYAASNGFTGIYRTSSCGLSVVPVATSNGVMERDYWYTSAHHLCDLDQPQEVGKTAAMRTLRRLGARKVSTCEVPVIFDPETAASLLRHLAGAVSGNALYKGTSFLIGKLGERIAPSFVQVSDDGRIPRAPASKPFDAEGIATRRTNVVEGGVLMSYLFDSYSARKLESHSTGNAARSVADVPQVSPTNYFLHAGETTPEAIIDSVRSGLYVTELMGFGVNPVTGDYSRGAMGIWIEDGEFTHAVSEVTIAGNLLHMFRDIEVVGSDLVRRRGISAPTVKVGRMTVAGN
jgi:PmbA protein